MKIYVDTNWFLAFYQSVADRDDTLQELRKHVNIFVLTEQNILEFRRNRQRLLKALRTKIKETTTVKPWTTGLTRSFPEHRVLTQAVSSMEAAAKALTDRIESIETGTDDPVMAAFDYLISYCQIIPVTNDIISRAHRRKLQGNPPSSSKRDTIGDEIIWECLLEECREDLAMISMDSDFLENRDILEREFHAHRSHRDLVYLGPQAIRRFGEIYKHKRNRLHL